jgi:hypothetical protein
MTAPTKEFAGEVKKIPARLGGSASASWTASVRAALADALAAGAIAGA